MFAIRVIGVRLVKEARQGWVIRVESNLGAIVTNRRITVDEACGDALMH